MPSFAQTLPIVLLVSASAFAAPHGIRGGELEDLALCKKLSNDARVDPKAYIEKIHSGAVPCPEEIDRDEYAKKIGKCLDISDVVDKVADKKTPATATPKLSEDELSKLKCLALSKPGMLKPDGKPDVEVISKTTGISQDKLGLEDLSALLDLGSVAGKEPKTPSSAAPKLSDADLDKLKKLNLSDLGLSKPDGNLDLEVISKTTGIPKNKLSGADLSAILDFSSLGGKAPVSQNPAVSSAATSSLSDADLDKLKKLDLSKLGITKPGDKLDIEVISKDTGIPKDKLSGADLSSILDIAGKGSVSQTPAVSSVATPSLSNADLDKLKKLKPEDKLNVEVTSGIPKEKLTGEGLSAPNLSKQVDPLGLKSSTGATEGKPEKIKNDDTITLGGLTSPKTVPELDPLGVKSSTGATEGKPEKIKNDDTITLGGLTSPKTVPELDPLGVKSSTGATEGKPEKIKNDDTITLGGLTSSKTVPELDPLGVKSSTGATEGKPEKIKNDDTITLGGLTSSKTVPELDPLGVKSSTGATEGKPEKIKNDDTITLGGLTSPKTVPEVDPLGLKSSTGATEGKPETVKNNDKITLGGQKTPSVVSPIASEGAPLNSPKKVTEVPSVKPIGSSSSPVSVQPAAAQPAAAQPAAAQPAAAQPVAAQPIAAAPASARPNGKLNLGSLLFGDFDEEELPEVSPERIWSDACGCWLKGAEGFADNFMPEDVGMLSKLWSEVARETLD